MIIILQSTHPDRLSYKEASEEGILISLGRGNRVYFPDGLGESGESRKRYQVRGITEERECRERQLHVGWCGNLVSWKLPETYEGDLVRIPSNRGYEFYTGHLL